MFSHPVVSDSLRPQGLQPTRFLCPWKFSGKTTGVGCHLLVQEIFPTQGWNPGLLHCRRILYPLSHLGSLILCCSVTLCDPMDSSMPTCPVLHHPLEFVQTHAHWVSSAIQPSHPLPSPSPFSPMFPSITVFSNKSALHIRSSKYWDFSFSISPSNEYSGLISFKIDWFDLLAV